jgi:hypothetical protein
VDRKLDLAAGRRRAFGNQLRRDVLLRLGRERRGEQEDKEDEEPSEHLGKRYSFVPRLQNRFTIKREWKLRFVTAPQAT